jgi:cellulose synthase/poly-beta-1,6-N-acetylglucosamine synthase-like glycosyltransferase
VPDLHPGGHLPAHLSARSAFDRRSVVRITAVVVPLVILTALFPRHLLPAFSSVLTALYLATTIDRHWLVLRGLRAHKALVVDERTARSIPDDELPCYTVLLPVYDEPSIVANLINGVGKLDYPKHKLEILLLVEADDAATQTALENVAHESVRVVVVPHSLPKTKPKACNYGMSLPDLRGEYITIYDAEDVPDPLQLRRALAAFRQSGSDVGCVQARLSYFNERHNLLTRWFTLEYDQWFGVILPAVEASGCVVPLGGTSNHMRATVWHEVGGWDEYNVTEDADLGVRLARRGYHTVILDSVTLEEANSDVVNWIRQRSRWYKGYLQTAMVHLRHPAQLVREIGLLPTLRLIGMTGAVPLTSAFNVVLGMALLIWIGGRPDVIGLFFPPVTYYVCLAMLLIGAPFSLFIALMTAQALGKPHLWWAALLSPLYWVLQSFAALKALYQLIFRPYYWEKTVHGLSTPFGTLPKGAP